MPRAARAQQSALRGLGLEALVATTARKRGEDISATRAVFAHETADRGRALRADRIGEHGSTQSAPELRDRSRNLLRRHLPATGRIRAGGSGEVRRVHLAAGARAVVACACAQQPSLAAVALSVERLRKASILRHLLVWVAVK